MDEVKLEVGKSQSRAVAIYARARDLAVNGVAVIPRKMGEIAATIASGAAYAATHRPDHSLRQLTHWVKQDPTRAFGYSGLMGDVAMLAAGGVSSNPLIAYCGLSGLTLQAMNSAFGEKVAPATTAMIAVQGMALAASGLGLGHDGGASAAEVVSGLCVSGAGISMGINGWRQMITARGPQKLAPPPAVAAPKLEVASSRSQSVGMAADVPGLAGRLGRLADKVKGEVLTNRNLTSALFASSSVIMIRDAVASGNHMMMAAAGFFLASTLAARVQKDEAPQRSTPPVMLRRQMGGSSR